MNPNQVGWAYEVVSGRPRLVSNEEIFQAINAIVIARGPQLLSLARIAQQLAVTGPSLSHRFGSKHGLLVSYVSHNVDAIPFAFASARQSQTSSLETLRAALLKLAPPVTRREQMAHFMEFLSIQQGDAEIAPFLQRHHQTLRVEICRTLEEAQEAGELVGIDPTSLATVVQTQFAGALATWVPGGEGSLRNWITSRLRLVLAPYRPAPDTDSGRSTSRVTP